MQQTTLLHTKRLNKRSLQYSFFCVLFVSKRNLLDYFVDENTSLATCSWHKMIVGV